MKFSCLHALACGLLAAGSTIGMPAGAEPPANEAGARIIPADTVVEFDITDHLNSKLSTIGEMFHIRLAIPILVNGTGVIPAGTSGMGEVIHAARARAGGKAGELILAVRYLDYAGQRIPLRSFRFGKGGQSNTDAALAVAFAAGPFAYLVVGGEVDVPAGTAGHAKIAADVALEPATTIQSTEGKP